VDLLRRRSIAAKGAALRGHFLLVRSFRQDFDDDCCQPAPTG
jgi:hypothetical protein